MVFKGFNLVFGYGILVLSFERETHNVYAEWLCDVYTAMRGLFEMVKKGV